MAQVVQSACNTAGDGGGSGVSSVTCAFGSNNTANNNILVFAWCKDSILHSGCPNPPTISDTRGNSYSLLQNADGGGSFETAIWQATGIAAGANTVTVSGGTGFTSWVISIAETKTAAISDAHGLSATGSSVTSRAASVTTSGIDEFVAFLADGSGTQTFTPTALSILTTASGTGAWARVTCFESSGTFSSGSYTETVAWGGGSQLFASLALIAIKSTGSGGLLVNPGMDGGANFPQMKGGTNG